MQRLLALLLLLAPLAHADDDWKPYQDRDGVVSYTAEIPGTKVLAMRGVTTTELPMAQVMGAFLDVDRAADWVDLMMSLEQLPGDAPDVTIERQRFDMSWPVTDREFVFRRQDTYDPEAKRVTVVYHSVDDPRFPPDDDFIRATDHGTTWIFEALPEGGTRIDVVAKVDPEGALPKWLFNAVQKGWPRATLAALIEEAGKPGVTPEPRCAGW